MNEKWKPWKYGLVGMAGGSIISLVVLVVIFLITSDFRAIEFLELAIPGVLGYVGGRFGRRWTTRVKSPIFAALLGGLVFIICGAFVAAVLYLSILFWFGHVP